MAKPEGKRGPVRWVWDTTTYWARRPAQDIKASLASMHGHWNRYQELRAERAIRARERGEAYERRMEGIPPSERFAIVAAEGGWTQAEIKAQEAAARRARRSCLVMAALGFVGFLASLLYAPFIVVLAFGFVAVALLAACLALAVRHAWWEFELQGKVLIPFRTFLARPDLIRRLFK